MAMGFSAASLALLVIPAVLGRRAGSTRSYASALEPASVVITSR